MRFFSQPPAPTLREQVIHSMEANGLGCTFWPRKIQEVIGRGSKLGHTADKYDSLPRIVVWVFLLHNGAPPAVALEWLHTTGRVSADALDDMVRMLKKLRDGALTSNGQAFTTTCLRGSLPKDEVTATLPTTSRDGVDAADDYAKQHGAQSGADLADGSAASDEASGEAPLAKERAAYFEQLFPLTELATLLHRRESPFHLREITVGKEKPAFRCQPILSVGKLEWTARKRGTSLHAGSAHDAETQEPLLGCAPALRTELCLEIDDLPTELVVGLSDSQRWRWLKHALGVVTDVLRTEYGVQHLLTFASGNKGPHCWLLDGFVLDQSASDRRALFEALETPTRQAWWRGGGGGGYAERCTRFYTDVLLAPVSEGGFGLAERERSEREIAALTWPVFDRDVALGAKHTHRLPFSVHEKSMRIAVPFASVDAMPTCLEGMPHVTDPSLAIKLEAPLEAMRAVVAGLWGAQLLLPHAELSKPVSPVATASWAKKAAEKAAERKRKRDETFPRAASVKSTATSRPRTGRVVELRLTEPKDALLASLQPALAARAERDADASSDGVDDAITTTTTTEARAARVEKTAEGYRKRAVDGLAKLYAAAAADGVVTFNEEISPEGRLSYASGNFKGVKGLLCEVRARLFAGAWRVDLKRCHTRMLLGAYGCTTGATGATGAAAAPRDATLDRMCTNLEGVEAELEADQDRLLPAALNRLEAARGTDGEANAAKFVGYLRSAPKTLLSAMLNHPNDSPMFKAWPLAAACCRAFGVAAEAGCAHPLVAADPHGSTAKMKQRVAFILERGAVVALVRALEATGMEPSLTINDEVLFYTTNAHALDGPTDVEALEATLAAAVKRELGFEAPLRVERV
jgi:hypothetical protein